MSKTYILLKDLPDAKAGSEFTHDGDDSYNYTSTQYSDLTSWYKESIVENNPEWFMIKEEKINNNNFWNDETVKGAMGQMKAHARFFLMDTDKFIDEYKASKQISKDYEVIAFSVTGTEKLLLLQKDGKYRFDSELQRSGFSLEFNLTSNDAKIEVVKRLPDNNIFSVDEITEQGRITAFDLRHDTIYVKVKEYVGSYLLSEVQKVTPKSNQQAFTLQEIKEELGRNCSIDIQERIIRKLQNSKA